MRETNGVGAATTVVGGLSCGRVFHTATRLLSGDFLIVGGIQLLPDGAVGCPVEMFTPEGSGN